MVEMISRTALVLFILGAMTAGCQFGMPFTVAPLPVQQIKQDCVIVQAKLPDGFLTGGTVLLGDFSDRALIGKIMTLTSDFNQPVYISDVPIYWGGETSPNRKLFAYETVDEKNDSSSLIVLDNSSKVRSTIPWDKKRNGFYWLNNQQIEFPYVWEGYWQNAPPTSDIINVLTRQHETITPPLIDPWVPGGPPIMRLVVWKAIYDPTMSIVGYMRGNEPNQSFVLWDLKNKHELWELTKWSIRTIRPAWSPNGKMLAIAVLNQKEDNFNRFELYLVGRDGQAKKWIDIKGYFKDAGLSIGWSPDGRYLIIIPTGDKPFLILDTITRELLNYCISANSDYDGLGIWSADSSQVVIPHANDLTYPSIVLNIKNKQAAYILEFRVQSTLTKMELADIVFV